MVRLRERVEGASARIVGCELKCKGKWSMRTRTGIQSAIRDPRIRAELMPAQVPCRWFLQAFRAQE